MSANFNKISFFAVFFTAFTLGFSSFAQHAEHETAVTETVHEAEEESEELNVGEKTIHHVLDDYFFEFSHSAVIHLPVIVYSPETGWNVFSSARFVEGHHLVAYNGFEINHEDHKIHLVSTGERAFSLSITKNVVMILLDAILLIWVLTSVAKAYRRNAGKAPSGLQSLIEPIILFVRDEVVKPNIGPRYEKFLPYMLTLFFFILFGNLLGLLPGAGNAMGNIGVTCVLAILTFILTNINGNRHYWAHIFWTPGVPLLLRPIIILVEVIGIFTKPISLMVRLFVAITAGHIVLLSLICLIFIFRSIWVGVGSTVIVLFIDLIELMVAGIQAYVFTLFSSLYIGMAIAEHEHHEEHH